tara:strand:- start:688 stop:1269 length:582 start_codon:yes stop_codon:yes gene_type:complete
VISIQENLFGEIVLSRDHSIANLVKAVLRDPKNNGLTSAKLSRLVYSKSLPFAELRELAVMRKVDKSHIYDLPYMMPCPETVCRSIREGKSGGLSDAVPDGLPKWYTDYLLCDHWKSVKQSAVEWLGSSLAEYCLFNINHPQEAWHHASYRSLGSGTEFQDIRPVCNSCHEKLRSSGPPFPKRCPAKVIQWIS